jgi:hypothetical protein
VTDPNPYAALLHAHYWKGYSREQDLKLVRTLFFGTAICDEKGRDRHGYWAAGSPEEREGLEALQRLLMREDLEAIAMVCCAFDPDSKVPRRLVFKQKRKGRADPTADSQIAIRVLALKCLYGIKPEAAIKQAEDEFGLERAAVFRAIARNKKAVLRAVARNKKSESRLKRG